MHDGSEDLDISDDESDGNLDHKLDNDRNESEGSEFEGMVVGRAWVRFG